MGEVVALPVSDAMPSPAKLRAARRAYREGCKAVADYYVAKAFNASFQLPGGRGVDLNDALPIFVAAMRRELCRAWKF